MIFFYLPIGVQILAALITILIAVWCTYLTGAIAKRMHGDVGKIIPVLLSFCVFSTLLHLPQISLIEGSIRSRNPSTELLLISVVVHVLLYARFDYFQLRNGFNLRRILQRRPSEL